jgi:hypothetical protein
MKNDSERFVIINLFFVMAMLLTIPSHADDLILGGTTIPKHYLIQLNGTVMNETFSGAQALLTIMPPSPGGTNPYQVIIQGFPKKNSRNSFFWNSEDSEMTAISNDITCDIKRTFVKQIPMHFIFMSPELLAHTGALALLGDEGKKLAEKGALPTLINARAGKLKFRAYSNSVSGTVWMKGYDFVEKAFVQYSAAFSGKPSYNLQPKQELRK